MAALESQTRKSLFIKDVEIRRKLRQSLCLFIVYYYRSMKRGEGMPYVLKHRENGEIAASVQKNNYDLDYYGVRWWDFEEDATAEREAFLNSIGISKLGDWLVYYVDESQVKRFNVKLKNNPALRVCMNKDGQTVVSGKEEQL